MKAAPSSCPLVKEGTTPKVPTFRAPPIGKAKAEVPTTAPKAPAAKFEEEGDIGSPPPPPPTEPYPDDVPKGEDVSLLKKTKAPPEVRSTYFGPESTYHFSTKDRKTSKKMFTRTSKTNSSKVGDNTRSSTSSAEKTTFKATSSRRR